VAALAEEPVAVPVVVQETAPAADREADLEVVQEAAVDLGLALSP